MLYCSNNSNLDYTQAFANRFNLPFPSPRQQRIIDRQRLVNATHPEIAKGPLAKLPEDVVQEIGKVFLGGNIPLKYIINYTSNKSTHYPYLLNL